MLKGTYIPTSAALLEGDKVETSGLGGIYPKGITIGTVKQIIETKNLTNRYILVEPAVNFDKLETVLVIIKKDKHFYERSWVGKGLNFGKENEFKR